MGKKYNYYDTPYNDPEDVKYRIWETAILLFGIGVVSTLLLVSHFFGNRNPDPPTVNQAVVVHAEPQQAETSCQPMNITHVQERNRLIQLLSIASDLPIEYVDVNQVGTVCYDADDNPTYDLLTDIRVTVGYTPAAKLSDYEALGNHVASLLPPMMQIHSDQPRDVIIIFLVGDSYLEWKHDYKKTALYTKGMRGEALWFWVEPEY